MILMKLSAWRDDIDISDAEHLLQVLLTTDGSSTTSPAEIWTMVEPYLTPGDELKASYAFLDLWENMNDQD